MRQTAADDRKALALARINPNFLTFLGLVIDTVAAFLFGYANVDNQASMFLYAGLVIIGAGFFDLVDGRVARASNRVTRFGAFFDSVSIAIAMRLCSSGFWSTTRVAIGSYMWCWQR